MSRMTIGQALEIAVRHHRSGQLADAADIYRQILAAEPKHHAALHMLGVVAHEEGDLARAHALITKAVEFQPDIAEMHGNLGLVLQDMGRLDDAITCFGTALSLDPEFAAAHCNLGGVLHEQGRHDDAIASFDAALALDPDLAEAHGNLGNVLRDLGRLDDAIARFDQALALDPGFAAAHGNRGAALQIQGRLEDAVGCFERALALDQALPEAHANLGIALTVLGRLDEALASHRQAIALAPANEAFWAGFAACVQVTEFTAADDALFADLLALLDRPSTDPRAVAPAILSALRHHPDFARLLSAASDIAASDAARMAGNPLLLRLISLSPLKDVAVEELLTALRRAMLGAVIAGEWNDRETPFVVALAHHCFVNEYVFAETPQEQVLVAQLEQGAASPAQLAMLGAYRPLHRFAWAGTLPGGDWPEELSALLTQQVLEPLAELALRDPMPRLTAIGGGVSQAVRAQYEENPYPRWIRFGGHGKADSIAKNLRGPPLGLPLEGYQSPAAPDILIAGCGTGQHSLLTANRFAGARILAVDLSLASLTYASRMTRDLGVSNIDYAQADIMALDEIDRRFDLIESVGVLHHLADPVGGWRILVDLLRPGGLMKIGLYSEAARQDVVSGRALIAERGYDSSPDGIRRCRRDIMALARGGVAKMARLSERDSFFTTSECRDLLFHVREDRFTLPRIETALRTLGLDFLGFEFADQEAMRRFRSANPEPGIAASLTHWHRFETDHPETFAGMYEFWVLKPHTEERSLP